MAYVDWETHFGATGSTDDVVINNGEEIEITGAVTARSVTLNPGSKLRMNPLESAELRLYHNLLTSGGAGVGAYFEMAPTSSPSIIHRVLWPAGSISDSQYVGGQNLTFSQTPDDVGIWVFDHTTINWHGYFRLPWTRVTGSLLAGQQVIEIKNNPVGWQIGDRLVITPTMAPDFTVEPQFSPHFQAYDEATITAINGKFITLSAPLVWDHPAVNVIESFPEHGSLIYTAEVMNMTRNVIIGGTEQGRAHVHFHARHNDYTLRNFRLEHLGPRQNVGNKRVGVEGRYALHFHHGYDSTRGLAVSSVVAENINNHVFVPHLSNGITFDRCVSHNTFDDAYWWDRGEDSNDLLWWRCIASKVNGDDAAVTGFELRSGDGNRMLGCVGVGVEYGSKSAGTEWPSLGETSSLAVWVPWHDNVMHNNGSEGIFSWNNHSTSRHVVDRFCCYHNGSNGINHGAYVNQFQYESFVLYGNRIGVTNHASPDRSGPAYEMMDPAKVNPDHDPSAPGLRYRHGLIDCKGQERGWRSIESNGEMYRYIRLTLKIANYTECAVRMDTERIDDPPMKCRGISMEGCELDPIGGAVPCKFGTEAPNFNFNPDSEIRLDDLQGTSFDLYPAITGGSRGGVWDASLNGYKLTVPSFGNQNNDIDWVNEFTLPQIVEPNEQDEGDFSLITEAADAWVDQFQGTTLNPRYGKLLGNTIEQNNALILHGGAPSPDRDVFTAIYRYKDADLTDVRTFVEVGQHPGGQAYQYFRVENGDETDIMEWRKMADGTLHAYLREDQSALTSIWNGAVADTFWAFRKAGTTLYWETSADGVNWTVRATHADTLFPATSIFHELGIGVIEDGAGAAQPGTFLSLNAAAATELPPVITIDASPHLPADKTWYTEAATVTISATNDGVIEYSLNGGPAQPYTGPILLDEEGDYHFEVSASNSAGEATAAHLVQIDLGIPVTTASVTDEPGGGKRVTFTATDPGAAPSGVDSITYRVDGGDWVMVPYDEQDPPFVVVAGGGPHTVEYYATDLALWEEAPQDVQFTITSTDVFEYKVWFSVGAAENFAGATLLTDWAPFAALEVVRPWIAAGSYYWVYVQTRDTLDLATSAVVSRRFRADLWEFRGWFSIGSAAVPVDERTLWFDWDQQFDLAQERPDVTQGQPFMLYLQSRDGATGQVGPEAVRRFQAEATAVNSPPNTPTLSVDVTGPTTVTLSCSAFSDPDVGDLHTITHWQIAAANDPNFDVPVYSVFGTGAALLERAVSSLVAGTDYLARCRHRDDSGDATTHWSAWAATVPFTTEQAGDAPEVLIDQGALINMLVGRTRQLTAQASGFPAPSLTWASDNELVATVDPNTGLVSAVGLGSCVVTVTATNAAGSDADAMTVNVIEPGPATDGTSRRIAASVLLAPTRRL